MNNPVYLFLLAAITYYACQKGIEGEPPEDSIEAHQWRLSGFMFDTTKYGNWATVDYEPDYSYDELLLCSYACRSAFQRRSIFEPL